MLLRVQMHQVLHLSCCTIWWLLLSIIIITWVATHSLGPYGIHVGILINLIRNIMMATRHLQSRLNTMRATLMHDHVTTCTTLAHNL